MIRIYSRSERQVYIYSLKIIKSFMEVVYVNNLILLNINSLIQIYIY
jgi:hypothetical protein